MIRIIVKLDKPVGGVEVSESALIRAAERGGGVFDDKPLL